MARECENWMVGVIGADTEVGSMRLAWLTDIHLNFVGRDAIVLLADEVRNAAPDAVLIGGDIGEADSVCAFLDLIATQTQLPVYFVLGNHDFYHGSLAAVRAAAEELTRTVAGPQWLPAAGVVRLTRQTALVGHDGWGDGGYGNLAGSSVLLNDFLLIEELRNSSERLPAILRGLGDEAAGHFRAVLPAALRDHEQVIALTHVPPFREASWHEGRESDEDWLPFFACRAVGDELRKVMAGHPHRRLKVLCGHTHSSGECHVLPNLSVLTGGAQYGLPRLQCLIEVP